jgi:hypothetical protein
LSTLRSSPRRSPAKFFLKLLANALMFCGLMFLSIGRLEQEASQGKRLSKT